MITVDSITKRFGHVTAVDDLSFQVQPGRITGFLGPNGAGKTTTLRLILGLIHADGGSAHFDGRRYEELDHPSSQVGAVLEEGSFHPGRSGRNHLRVLAAAGGHPPERVDEVLDQVGLDDRAASRRVKGYSLGMRQRLAIAAALLGDPEVLILDEPANGLDPPGIRWMRDLIREQASRGRTVLISSHLLSEVAQTVDDLVVISHGACARSGPLDEVLGARGEAVTPGTRRRPRAPRLGAPRRRDRDRSRRRRWPAGARHAAGARRPAGGRPRPRPGRAAPRLALARGRLPGAHRGGGSVKRLLEAELIKLRTTRTFVAMAAVAVGTSLLITLLVSLLEEPTEETVLVDVFASDTSGLFITLLAIIGITGEWRHRTITSSLLAAPHRTRFLAAKTLAFAVAGIALSLMIAVVVSIVGLTILSAPRPPTPELGELLGQVARNAAVAGLVGAFGVGLGGLVRNQLVAVITVLSLAFVVEPTLIGLAPEVGRYGPFGALPVAAADIPAGRGPARRRRPALALAGHARDAGLDRRGVRGRGGAAARARPDLGRLLRGTGAFPRGRR